MVCVKNSGFSGALIIALKYHIVTAVFAPRRCRGAPDFFGGLPRICEIFS